MFRVENLKVGGMTIETDCDINTIVDGSEVAHFLYLTETDFKELLEALIDRGIKKVMR